ncbi:fungal-specific transcription factor domain-containing protein [Lipomyces arxii]|uniref:fungal-specific transcription factor domain-containing protein n=1 Tax=Lipomyces arxii TaxID=56418 RepID=UPI0034CF9C42
MVLDNSSEMTSPIVYSCSACSKAFARAEHLDRHKRSHSQDHLKCFVCSVCLKGFTRKDVLTRHIRAVHETPSTPKRTRKKSCVRCANFKIKCSGGDICEACKKRSLDCVYEFRRVINQNTNKTPTGTAEDSIDDESEISQVESDMEEEVTRKKVKTEQIPSVLIDSAPTAPTLPPLHAFDATSPTQSYAYTPLTILTSASSPDPVEVFPLPPLPEHKFKPGLPSIPSPLSQLMSDDNLENWLFDPGVFELDWLRAELGVRDLYDPRVRDTRDSMVAKFGSQSILFGPTDRKPPASELSAAMPTPPLSGPAQSLKKTFYYDQPRQATTAVTREQQPTMYSPISPQPYVQPHVPRDLGSPPKLLHRPGHHTSAAHYKTSHSQSTWHREQTSGLPSLNLPPPQPFSSLVTRRGVEFEPQTHDIWPFAPRGQTSREESAVKLPPLRQFLEQTSTGFSKQYESINDQVRSEMLALLELPYERHPYAEVDITKFPDRATLDSFLRLYFEDFHPILPLIHRPTFRLATCPAILLATMISIGASYSDMEVAHQFADTLSELCKRTLQWMGNYDSNYGRSGYFVYAFCLQNIYALGSGDKRLYEEADECRSYLISCARSMGLFSLPPTEVMFSIRGDESDTELESLWHAWRDEEMGKRLAWSIFEYDCSISTLSSRRSMIALCDLCNDIPCDERLWEAATAREWAAYAFPNGRKVIPQGIPFYPMLRDLMAGTLQPDVIPNWGKRLFAQAVGRILWDFRELEDSALAKVLPMLQSDYSPAKECLLRVLMYLRDSMTSPYNILDMVHMNMTCLIAHYSHLYTAREIMDLVIALARNRKAYRVDAMHRIQVIFTLDPVNSRKLAWHAAQIIGIARQYPIRTPCETMRVFLAGLFLYAFAKYSHQDSRDSAQLAAKLDTLSWLPKDSQTRPEDLDRWFLQGGRASMDSVDDICARTINPDGTVVATGAEHVLAVVLATLRSMKIWGVAAKFCTVLIYVHKRDVAKTV